MLSSSKRKSVSNKTGPNPGEFVLVTVKEPDYAAAIGYIRQYLGEDLVHIQRLLSRFDQTAINAE